MSNPPGPPQPGPAWEPQGQGYGAPRPPQGYPPQAYQGQQGYGYQGYPPPAQFTQRASSGGTGRVVLAMIGLIGAALIAAVVEVLSQFHFHSNGLHWQTADVIALLNDLLVYGVIALGSVIVAIRASRGGLLVWGAALILGTTELIQGIFFPSGIAYYLSEKPRSGWVLATPLADVLLVVVALVALILVVGRQVRTHFLPANSGSPRL
jgi:hypothetical protein